MRLLLLLLFFPLQAEEDYHFFGTHYFASYHSCDTEALNDVERLMDVMDDAVYSCGATILESSHYIFPPTGLTMVYLLSESHASIHTYPEHNACFIDLFTCGTSCQWEEFEKVITKYLKPQRLDVQVINRGSYEVLRNN